VQGKSVRWIFVIYRLVFCIQGKKGDDSSEFCSNCRGAGVNLFAARMNECMYLNYLVFVYI